MPNLIVMVKLDLYTGIEVGFSSFVLTKRSLIGLSRM